MFSVTIFILFVTAYAHPHSYTLNNAVSFDDILPSSTYAEDNPIDLTPQNVIADAAATDPCIDYDTRPLFVKCGGPEIGRPKVWTLNTPIPYVLDCLPGEISSSSTMEFESLKRELWTGDKQRRVRVAREAPYCCVESSVQGVCRMLQHESISGD